MGVYHMVLIKPKPSISAAQISQFNKLAKDMVGQVPGLRRLDAGPPVAATAQRAQGYTVGINAVLDKPEDLPVYAGHAAHKPVNELRLEIAEDTIVFDMEFPDGN